MATLYVKHTGSNTAPYDTWAKAATTLSTAAAAASAGDRIWVSNNHTEATASNVTITITGTKDNPCEILCGDDSAEPPTSLATGASVACTVNNTLTICGSAYIYGLSFTSGNSTGNAHTQIATVVATPSLLTFKSCTFSLGSSGAAAQLRLSASNTGIDGQLCVFNGCSFVFANAGQTILAKLGNYEFENCTFAGTGTAPTTLITTNSESSQTLIRMCGCDLSSITGTIFDGTGDSAHDIELHSCRLGTGVTPTALSGYKDIFRLICSDSSTAQYRYYKSHRRASIQQETTIVRSGGASDGTTSISRKLSGSAYITFAFPIRSDWHYIWNESTGSGMTLTVETITDNITLTDGEIWLEVEYLGSASYPIATRVSNAKSDIIASASNHASSSKTWTTTGLTTPTKQYLVSPSFTPNMKGPVRWRVCYARNSTAYFCPKGTLA